MFKYRVVVFINYFPGGGGGWGRTSKIYIVGGRARYIFLNSLQSC